MPPPFPTGRSQTTTLALARSLVSFVWEILCAGHRWRRRWDPFPHRPKRQRCEEVPAPAASLPVRSPGSTNRVTAMPALLWSANSAMHPCDRIGHLSGHHCSAPYLEQVCWLFSGSPDFKYRKSKRLQKWPASPTTGQGRGCDWDWGAVPIYGTICGDAFETSPVSFRASVPRSTPCPIKDQESLAR